MRTTLVLLVFVAMAALASKVDAKTWEEDDMIIVEASSVEEDVAAARQSRQLWNFGHQTPPLFLLQPHQQQHQQVPLRRQYVPLFPAVSDVPAAVPVVGGFGRIPGLNQPCKTYDGRNGICKEVNDCNPKTKLFKFGPSEQWVMGTADTCRHQGETTSYVFGVCCPRPDSTPSANPSDVIVNGPGNKVEVDENDDEESEFPIEAQINSNCGQRFVGGRIVNGKVTRKHELPFMAAMINNGRQFCGGSVVDSRHILTAAHCVHHMSKNDVNNLRVVVGDQDIKNKFDSMSAKTYTVKRVIRHKNFDINTLFHDVAVLSLSQDINYDRSVQSVCLNRQPTHDFTGTTVQVAGWGATSAGSSTSSTLRKVDVRVWSNSQCADNQHYGQTSSKITANQICAATPESKKDSCSGDSGGPLFYCDAKCEQIGIVSFGIGCAEKRYPGVYTRVSKYINWIGKIVKKY